MKIIKEHPAVTMLLAGGLVIGIGLAGIFSQPWAVLIPVGITMLIASVAIN